MKRLLIIAALLTTAPLTAASPLEGIASWYGASFSGKRTASGERFDPSKLTAAHRTLPFGTKVQVTHQHASVTVRINDRGPFNSRIIDLSKAAAQKIGLVQKGHGRVTLKIV